MKPQELKNIIAAPNATILSEAFPLYQRNLVTDATGWLLVDVNYPDRSATTILAGGSGE